MSTSTALCVCAYTCFQTPMSHLSIIRELRLKSCCAIFLIYLNSYRKQLISMFCTESHLTPCTLLLTGGYTPLPKGWCPEMSQTQQNKKIQAEGRLSAGVYTLFFRKILLVIPLTMCWKETVIKGELHRFYTSKSVYRCWGALLHMWKQLYKAFSGPRGKCVKSDKCP